MCAQSLMRRCLSFDYERRPTFKQIVALLEEQVNALEGSTEER